MLAAAAVTAVAVAVVSCWLRRAAVVARVPGLAAALPPAVARARVLAGVLLLLLRAVAVLLLAAAALRQHLLHQGVVAGPGVRGRGAGLHQVQVGLGGRGDGVGEAEGEVVVLGAEHAVRLILHLRVEQDIRPGTGGWAWQGPGQGQLGEH